MQNGGKCQISDICQGLHLASPGCFQYAGGNAERSGGRCGKSITSRCTARWAPGRAAWSSNTRFCRHRIPGTDGTPQPRPWRTVGGWASVPLSCYPDGGQHPFLRDGAGAPWGTPYWSDHADVCRMRWEGAGSSLSRDGTGIAGRS